MFRFNVSTTHATLYGINTYTIELQLLNNYNKNNEISSTFNFLL